MSINTLLEPSNPFFERIGYQISRESKTGRSGDIGGPKDVSYFIDGPPGKMASKIRHAQPDPKRSDYKFFSRNDLTISKVLEQAVLALGNTEKLGPWRKNRDYDFGLSYASVYRRLMVNGKFVMILREIRKLPLST